VIVKGFARAYKGLSIGKRLTLLYENRSSFRVNRQCSPYAILR